MLLRSSHTLQRPALSLLSTPFSCGYLVNSMSGRSHPHSTVESGILGKKLRRGQGVHLCGFDANRPLEASLELRLKAALSTSCFCRFFRSAGIGSFVPTANG